MNGCNVGIRPFNRVTIGGNWATLSQKRKWIRGKFPDGCVFRGIAGKAHADLEFIIDYATAALCGQIHGAIGMTDAHDISTHFKSPAATDTLCGDSDHRLGRFSRLST